MGINVRDTQKSCPSNGGLWFFQGFSWTDADGPAVGWPGPAHHCLMWLAAAHQVFNWWAAARPGPFDCHLIGHGPARLGPSNFFNFLGPVGPGPSIFQICRRAPARPMKISNCPARHCQAHDTRSEAHETRALFGPRPAISLDRPEDLKGRPMCCPVL